MNLDQLLALYRVMQTSRALDQLEQELTSRGEAFFHVSGAGHEASAVLARHLTPADWLHCHYRDKALLLARGLAPRDFFDALYCNGNSHSSGRQMSAHMSSPDHNVLSIVGPVGNSALQAVGVAAAVKQQQAKPIVLCSVGDGTTQQGEFLEACAEAVRSELPVLFFIEDNRWAISTATPGKTFYSHPQAMPEEFYGMPIHRIDGRDPLPADRQLGDIVRQMRRRRLPAMVVFDVERLANHTNADDQTIYRDESEIRRAARKGDPIVHLEKHLLATDATNEQLAALQEEAQQNVAEAESQAAAADAPVAVNTAKRSLPVELTHPSRERRGSGEG